MNRDDGFSKAGAPDEEFAGSLAPFADALCWDPSPSAVAAADLADRQLFDTLIARLQAALACPDRLAVISFWSQSYFSRLTIPATIWAVSRENALPLDLADTRVSFCQDTGAPCAFHLDPAKGDSTTGIRLEPLVDRHIMPLIAIIQEHSGLSARLLWENAAWPLVWALGEISRLTPDRRPAIRRELASLTRPARGRHPLCGIARTAALDLPFRRRVCCLRHRMPGFAPCAGLCPLLPAADDGGDDDRQADHPGDE